MDIIYLRPSGGIGRHSGLKIRCSYGRAGSIPALATILSFTPYGGKKDLNIKNPRYFYITGVLFYSLRREEVLRQPFPLFSFHLLDCHLKMK